MTAISVVNDNGIITGIKISGHSGYATSGQDIVCAAITSAVRFLEHTLSDCMMLDTHPIIDNENALICISLDVDSARNDTVQILFKSFCSYMKALVAEYPRNICFLK